MSIKYDEGIAFIFQYITLTKEYQTVKNKKEGLCRRIKLKSCAKFLLTNTGVLT